VYINTSPAPENPEKHLYTPVTSAKKFIITIIKLLLQQFLAGSGVPG